MSFKDMLIHHWASQRDHWPDFAQSITSLENADYKWLRLPERGRFVILQCNSQRLTSTSANVDPDFIAQRPCFLCEKARPSQQSSLLFGEVWQILCNIAPITIPHFTIVSVNHEPQAIDPAIDMMVDLSHKADGDLLVFFNGVDAGASAPDHLHCQAIASNTTPFDWWIRGMVTEGWSERPSIWPLPDDDEEEEEDDEEIPSRNIEWLIEHDVRVGVTRGAVVPAVVVVGHNVADEVRRIVQCCAHVLPQIAKEPPTNVYMTYLPESEEWLSWIIPRPCFRPNLYPRIMVSPGAVDLADLILVPRKEDFDVLDGEELGPALREVVLSPAAFEKLISHVAQ